MHRVPGRGRAEVCAASIPLLIVSVFSHGVEARTVRVIAFNAPANSPYDAHQNGSLRRTIASSTSGVLHYAFEASGGDLVSFAPSSLSPPPPPVLTSVVSNGAGCAFADWQPSGDPTVVGYTVYAGTRSVAAGNAPAYDVAYDVGAASEATLCLLRPGTNYLAVRSRNFAGVLSAYSAEIAVIITTVAVTFTSFEATLADEGVRLTWRVETDEAIEGYRIYRSVRGGIESPLSGQVLPAGAHEFVDGSTRAGTAYQYVLGAVREDGSEVRSAPVAIATPARSLALGQNAPNPFNPATRIPFTLDRSSRVVVRVYDVRGGLVVTLFDGELAEGRHTLTWNGRDRNGNPVASGAYVYALTADRRTLSKKMTVLK